KVAARLDGALLGDRPERAGVAVRDHADSDLVAGDRQGRLARGERGGRAEKARASGQESAAYEQIAARDAFLVRRLEELELAPGWCPSRSVSPPRRALAKASPPPPPPPARPSPTRTGRPSRRERSAASATSSASNASCGGLAFCPLPATSCANSASSSR